MYSFVCFAVLAVVAQANACPFSCDDDSQTLRFGCAPTFVSAAVQEIPSAQASLPSFDLSGLSYGAQSTERVDRNTYQVSLDNTGPTTVNCPPVVRSQKQAPVVQKPTITLPARIPGTRTLSNQCKCVKTIVKPQVYEQLITVPIVQRYIQTTHRPVVEKIHYQAVPVNAQDNIECSSGSGVQSQLVAVEAPRLELEAPRFEIEAPRLEVQAPRFEIEAPRLELQAPRYEIEVPRLEVQAPRFEEVPSYEQVSIPVQTVSSSSCSCY